MMSVARANILALIGFILLAGAGLFYTVLAVDQTAFLTVPSSLTVTNVSIQNGTDITLIPNTTTSVTVSFSITNGQGCGHVFNNGGVTSTLFRTGVSSTCTANTLNCYTVTTSTHNCTIATTTSANATATFDIWYFAQATDASSSYPSEQWGAVVSVRNGSSTTASSSASNVELNTLLALNLTSSSLNYGALDPNSDTTSTNQIAGVKNAGNASTSLQINAQATLVSGSNSFPTSSQHYATGTFTFGGAEQQLQSTAQTVSGFTVARNPLARWTNTTALPVEVGRLSAEVYNGYLYSIGGRNAAGTRTSTVRFAALAASGTVGAWTNTTPLTSAMSHHRSAVYNGYLYVGGGLDSAGASTTTVRFAPINATGSIGAWVDTTPLSAPLSSVELIAHNGYLYKVGGDIGGGVSTATVQFALINATGSIGTWTDTTPLPFAFNSLSLAVYNGRLYTLGGGNDVLATATVRFASINATGSIGAWVDTTPLPSERTTAGAVVDEGILYSFGGLVSGTETSSVVFSPIETSGRLGLWVDAPAMPAGGYAFGRAYHNGYVYTVGGTLVGLNSSTVNFAPLASRNTYWGLSVPAGQAAGNYSGTTVFTAVFAP